MDKPTITEAELQSLIRLNAGEGETMTVGRYLVTATAFHPRNGLLIDVEGKRLMITDLFTLTPDQWEWGYLTPTR